MKQLHWSKREHHAVDVSTSYFTFTLLQHSFTLTYSGTASKPRFDAKKMHEKGSRESQTLVDDGSGKVEIWRIEDFDMVPLEPGLYGQFFGGDSYVILYTYLLNGKENYIVYFWQGAVCRLISLS